MSETDSMTTTGAGCRDGKRETTDAKDRSQRHRDRAVECAEHHAGTEAARVMVFSHDSLCLSEGTSGAIIADNKSAAVEVSHWSHSECFLHGHIAIFAWFGESDAL